MNMKFGKKLLAVIMAVVCLTTAAMPAMAATSTDRQEIADRTDDLTVTRGTMCVWPNGGWRNITDANGFHWYLAFDVPDNELNASWTLSTPAGFVLPYSQWDPLNGEVRFGVSYFSFAMPPYNPNSFYIY